MNSSEIKHILDSKKYRIINLVKVIIINLILMEEKKSHILKK